MTRKPRKPQRPLIPFGRDYDIDYVIMRFRLPAGPEREQVLDCIRLFGEEVLPQFYKWGRFVSECANI